MSKLLSVCVLFVFFGCSTEAARILGIFHIPTKSHFIIGSTILYKLAERGHDVIVASPFTLSKKNANYKEIYLDGLNEIGEEMRSDALNFTKGKADIQFGQFRNYFQLLVRKTIENPEIQQLAKSKQQFDVVMLEPFWNEGFLGFGHIFNAQIVMLSAGNTAFANEYVGNVAPYSFVPNVMTTYSDKMTFIQRVVNSAMTIFFDIMITLATRSGQKALYEEFFKEAPAFEEAIRNISLLLVNSHVLFETPRPYLPNMIPIGGAHIQQPKKLPTDLQTFLDSAKDGAIFFSLGSNLNSKTLPNDKVEAILKTFAKFPQKILWKFEDESLIEKLPKNMKIAKWLPQADILAHPNVRLFITHGGLLSTSEAMFRGVPIIGIPVYGDQFANIAHLVSKGCGQQLLLEDLTEEIFTKLIQEVLNNKSYEVNIKRSSAILQDQINNPLDRAIFWIEHIIKHGSQHLRSASVDLSLAQYLLLDVIAFITVIFGTFIIGIYLTMKTICCRRKRKVINNKEKRKSKRE